MRSEQRNWLAPALLAVTALLFGGVGGWYARGLRGGPGASTGVSGREIIARAIAAERECVYEGRQRLEIPRLSGGGLRHLEAYVSGAPGGHSYIEYLTAPLKGVKIWYDDDTAYRYTPSANSGEDQLTVSTRRASRDDLASQGEQLLANYEASRHGAESIAGRPAWVVDLHPRGDGGPWRRLWIDQEHWLVLASTHFDAADQKIQSREFITIEFRPSDQVDLSDFRPPAELLASSVAIRPSDMFAVKELRDIVEIDVQMPRYLPTGYQFEGGYVHHCGEERRLGARLEFTDGAKRITLIECPDQGANAMMDAPAPLGTGSVYRGHADGLVVTATGQVSDADLKRLVESLVASF